MARILIVDDEAEQINVLAIDLKMAGWETGSAGNGVEGVLRVLDGGWDLVLMDIRMPRLDGIGALQIIKRIAPNLPVIMFTGQAGQGDMYETTRLGAYTCLLKPVDFEQLHKVIDEIRAYKTFS